MSAKKRKEPTWIATNQIPSPMPAMKIMGALSEKEMR